MWPDLGTVRRSHSHDLGDLVKLAGLDRLRVQEGALDPAFLVNWQTVKDWRADSRYSTWPQKSARDMILAIDDPQHGVLQWIKRYW
jgi:hypothetical protein